MPRSVLVEIADPIEFYAELISEDFFASLPIDTRAHQALLRREAGGREVTAHVRWCAYASESCVARVFALHRLTRGVQGGRYLPDPHPAAQGHQAQRKHAGRAPARAGGRASVLRRR